MNRWDWTILFTTRLSYNIPIVPLSWNYSVTLFRHDVTTISVNVSDLDFAIAWPLQFYLIFSVRHYELHLLFCFFFSRFHVLFANISCWSLRAGRIGLSCPLRLPGCNLQRGCSPVAGPVDKLVHLPQMITRSRSITP